VERRALLRLLAGAVGLCAWRAPGGARAARRVQVTLRRFELVPAQIDAAAGEPLTLVLASVDFVHGFGLPDFDLRRDVVPGQPLEVTFTPARRGRFHYLCDNFCGEGHDRMSGILVVS